MNDFRRRSISAIASAAVIALLSGCSSGNATAPSTHKQLTADKQLAQNAVLRAIDMPDGYKGSPHDNSAGNSIPKADAQKLATCANVPEADIESLLNGTSEAGAPTAEAPDFVKSTPRATVLQIMFQNNVAVERSSKDLTKSFDRFGAKSVMSCWTELFRSQVEAPGDPGESVHGLTVKSLPISGVGDQSVAVEAKVVVDSAATRSAPATSEAVYLDLYLARRGRAGIALLVSGVGGPASRALEKSLLETVAGRLGAAG